MSYGTPNEHRRRKHSRSNNTCKNAHNPALLTTPPGPYVSLRVVSGGSKAALS
jgi:hypothetical protein